MEAQEWEQQGRSVLAEEYLHDEGYPEAGGRAEADGDAGGRYQSAPRSVTFPLGSLLNLFIGLVIGVLIGYLGRPLISPEAQPPASPAAGNAAAPAAVVQPTPATSAAASAADAQALMQALIAQTRHFKGDPNAPVTIIEFSDFQ